MSALQLVRVCRNALVNARCLSTTPVTFKAAQTAQATDPIQQLFLDKLRLYTEKSKKAGGKLVDATPEFEATYKAEIDRVQKTFSVKPGDDFTKFPTLNFQDSELEPVGVTVELKDVAETEDVIEDDYDPERRFYVPPASF